MDDAIKKELINSKAFNRVFAVCAFGALTLLGSFVRIPLLFTPVPITLQTLFVLLSCALLGWQLGVASQLAAAALGSAAGVLAFAGPTAGYICGFLFAGAFCGYFIKYARENFIAVVVVFTLADLIILACGTLWLSLLSGVSLSSSFLMGFVPFIPGDMLKVMVAASLYQRLSRRFRQALG